jgi:hypothetical protein
LAVAQERGKTGIAFGLLQSAQFAAVPFGQYVAENPGDYKAGIYNGLSALIGTQNGFIQITFNIDITQIAAGS